MNAAEVADHAVQLVEISFDFGSNFFGYAVR